ncbi:MAG: hypothetical protein U1E83_04635 [Methylotetracoccus sp.]
MNLNILFPIALLLLAGYAYADSNDNFLIGVIVMFVIWLVAFVVDHFRRFFPRSE